MTEARVGVPGRGSFSPPDANSPMPNTFATDSRPSYCLPFRTAVSALALAYLAPLACVVSARADVAPAADPAQDSGSIAGSLTTPKGGPLAASIAVTEHNISAPVSAKGQFRLEHLAPGTYTLIITADGYTRVRIPDVTVKASTQTELAPVALTAVSPATSTVSDETVHTLEKYVVEDRKVTPFTDRNVDIPRTIDDIKPYYIFDATTIAESGANDVESFLKNRLTMNTNEVSLGQGYANSYGNTSTVNLRGLGTDATLVLVNGRERAGVSRGTSFGQPDLNGIPIEAIERIEILPSSAAAIYGASALGGVINVILKGNFSGGSLRTVYENPFKSDAPIRSINLSEGIPLEHGKTQLTFNLKYSDGKGLLSQDRLDLARRGIQTILQNYPGYFYSATSPFLGGATPNIALYKSAYTLNGVTYTNPSTTSLVLKNGTSLNALNTFVPYGTTPGSDASTGYLANAGKYNTDLGPNTGSYGLHGTIGWAPSRNRSFMTTLSRNMTSWLELFTEFSYEGSVAITNYTPFGAYVMVNASPANPFQQNIYVTLPVDLSVPDINNSITRTSTIGFKADLPFNWKAQGDYTWSQNTYTLDFAYIDSTGVATDLASGALNPFADTTVYALNARQYLAPGHWAYKSTNNNAGLRLSGPVYHLPWGAPTLTIGLKHQLQGLANGSVTVLYPKTTANSYRTTYIGHTSSDNSAYGEATIPLITGKNSHFLLRELEVQAVGRVDEFTVDTGSSYFTNYFNRTPATTTYYPANAANVPYSSKSKYPSRNSSLGLKYKPFHSLTLRASNATAFVPPTFSQLLPNITPSTATTQIFDPKTNTQYGVYTVSGGDPNLKPKTARSASIGLIYEPRNIAVLEGLRFAVDYTKTKQDSVITTLSAQQIISDPAFANRVTRDPTTGLITQVNLAYLNLNQYEMSGADLTLNYHRPTIIGIFDLASMLTVTFHDKRQLTYGGKAYEYVTFLKEGGEIRHKANLSLTWHKGHWQAGWNVTYFDPYKLYYAPGSPYYQQYGAYTTYIQAQGSDTVPSQAYHDAFLSYSFDRDRDVTGSQVTRLLKVENLLTGVSVQVTVKNVFDKVPPLDVVNSPYYYSNYGDPRLRSYVVSIKKEF